jgi:acetamidase/formamidase
MRIHATPFLMTTLLFLSVAPVAAAQPAGPSGRWLFHFISYGEEFASARVLLNVDGDAVSGTLNELSLGGTYKNGRLAFHATRPDGTDFGLFEGKSSGRELRGVLTSRGNQAPWVMRRLPARPSTPQTHVVEPTSFSRTFNSTASPLARIHPGDSVKTWTIDSAGYDKAGVRRSFGGNPQTGPFYVEGAVPGDTLVVKLDRITLNRDTARSGARMVSTTTTPDYFKNTNYDDAANGDWILDRKAKLGRLTTPSERLRDYRVELNPFLGGIGVAPPDKQAIDARSLGSFGGNLDYNQLTEGTTIYLPVNEDGALLFVGDGHAAQGAGEVTGDALETSLDLEFTVELLEGKGIGAPRAESQQYLMAMGIAGSLHDAVRQATTALAEWLTADQGLSANDVALVLGTAVEYDIAELVDPQFNVVAKLRKDRLPGQARQ